MALLQFVKKAKDSSKIFEFWGILEIFHVLYVTYICNAFLIMRTSNFGVSRSIKKKTKKTTEQPFDYLDCLPAYLKVGTDM